MPNLTKRNTLIRRAIAFVSALVPIVALAVLPMQASAMKVVITDIQGDDNPSWDPCPFSTNFSALFNVSDYTGTPHVKFVYHWETTGLLSGRHWRSPDQIDEFDLVDLARLAKMPGFTAADIHDSKQTNHSMTEGPSTVIKKHVVFVMTQPVYAKLATDEDKTCHS